ncbi:MAG: Mo-dependent nitrogenase C-terminal domain-containing protein [Cyanobacteria bacterium P01_D01_bin.105]
MTATTPSTASEPQTSNPSTHQSSAPQESLYTQAQIEVWLRGLLSVAWADGHFEEAEKEMIHSMVESEFAPRTDFETLSPIAPAELAKELHLNSAAAQNFLRMAVMVAIANGIYSEAEDAKIMAFAEALDIREDALTSLRTTLQGLKTLDSTASHKIQPTGLSQKVSKEVSKKVSKLGKTVTDVEPLKPARDWLDQLAIDDPRLARFVCKMVPSQCPFERDVTLFGHKIVHIPPMCKINPLYEQLVGLRFRALSYLADDCGEDVTPYV